MGLEPGTYQLGQQRVTIDGVGAYLTNNNILAGRLVNTHAAGSLVYF